MTSFHIVQAVKTQDITSDDLYACNQLFLLRKVHQLLTATETSPSLMFRLAQH